jgi:hypothetical protein
MVSVHLYSTCYVYILLYVCVSVTYLSYETFVRRQPTRSQLIAKMTEMSYFARYYQATEDEFRAALRHVASNTCVVCVHEVLARLALFCKRYSIE